MEQSWLQVGLAYGWTEKREKRRKKIKHTHTESPNT